MRTALTIILSLLITTVFGQTNDYKVLLDSAKTLFKSEMNLNQEELDQFDYSPIVSLLEKVIEIKPDDAEARYFLGDTYSRMNARDGRGMVAMDLGLLYKTSEQFEKVIELTPKYTDEMIVLDPYSKLTGEWGSMAMSYWYNNKTDSAIWAFREGKKRGGFGNFILELNKNVLDACSKNAILMSSGDNFSFPLWYLQMAENYRKDVAVVDINLLNTNWYPAFLAKSKFVAFNLPNEVLNTIEYTPWTDSVITIKHFSWTVKPSYYSQYLLRGDRVFLSLLKENKFQRDLYFTTGFAEDARLSLKDYLTPLVVVDKLTIRKKKKQSFKNYKKATTTVLKNSMYLNLNSTDELGLFDHFRYNILGQINGYLEDNNKKKAEQLMQLLDEFANDSSIPYQDKKGKDYADELRRKI